MFLVKIQLNRLTSTVVRGQIRFFVMQELSLLVPVMTLKC